MPSPRASRVPTHRPRRTPTRRPRRALRLALTAVLVAAGWLPIAASAPADAAQPASLAVGGTLRAGSGLTSTNGLFDAVMQADGNFVVYGETGALWSTRTGVPGSRVVLQTDGNLVVYTPADAPLWSSRTAGRAASRLVLQDDGDLAVLGTDSRVLWHSDTAQELDPVSVGSSVPAGTALTPLRYLTSPNGNVTARFTEDGSFVVAIPSRTLWTATAGQQPGERFLLQTDGNVVLYGATAPLWWSSTRSTTAVKLTIQDDGNLVAYSSAGAIWASRSSLPRTPNSGADRLLAGQQLVPGAAIVSRNRAYKFIQQTDGNLVVYRGSTPVWIANTAGWRGAYTILQTDGNLVTYANGKALWYSKSYGATAVVMQDDGNLVAYRASGGAMWSSKFSPKPPPLFPPQTSPPPTAVSRYLRNLHGTAADLTFMRAAGCSDARAVPNGERYLTFLAFGAQSTRAPGGWGVNLTASTGLISNGAVVAAVKSYIDGYRGCMQPYSHLTVAVGTNNDGEDAGLGSTGGRVWADQVVDPLAAYAAAGGRVTVAGANDFEPGFAGSAAQAVSWMQGYLAATPAPFVNTGSADGCPQSLGTTTSCNYGWTPRTLYDLTFGMMPGRSLPLVQVYYTSMARQWANISLVGRAATGRAMTFAGPLTEVTACQQAGSCYSMDAVSAWHTLWNQLAADSRTRISDLQYLTDLRIDR